jgi:hypothetical protein
VIAYWLVRICDALDVECDQLEADAARLRHETGLPVGNDFIVVAKTLRTLSRVVRKVVAS